MDLSFRIFFGGEPATLEDLALIDEISVDQMEDAAWEAQIVMSLRLDERGNWALQNEVQLAPRTQVRIELKLGKSDFLPLIDGPIVSFDTAMDSLPGRSTATIVVHDDSAWLNLASAPVSTEEQTDEELANQLFTENSDGHIASTEIELPTDTVPPSLGSSFAQLGTPMQMLRQIAARNGCHAYVLPGPTAGASIGCIKPDPADPESLPPLVLLGPGRNVASVTTSEEPDSSESTVVHTMRLSDQQIESYTTSVSDEELLGPAPAAQEAPVRTSPPGSIDGEDPAAAARARARRRNFPVRFSGTLLAMSYPALLQPHQKVALRAGGARQSTVLLLTRVVHRITPSAYTVEFEGRGNALAELSATESGTPAGVF